MHYIYLYSGIVSEIDSLACAEISGRLGAGRFKSSDSINYAVGLELCVHIGSIVKKGKTNVNGRLLVNWFFQLKNDFCFLLGQQSFKINYSKPIILMLWLDFIYDKTQNVHILVNKTSTK